MRQAASTPAERRDERAEETREALLTSARAAFADRGYAGSSLEDIVGPAGLTKGALYHHFGSKAGVFEAVYTAMSQRLVEAVEAALAAAGDEPWARIFGALDAFLEASSDPAYVRVVLIDAPTTIDVVRGRAIDQDLGLDLVASLVEDLVRRGGIRPVPERMLARVLLATTGEVALTMAAAPDLESARDEGREVMVALLEGLRA